MKTLLLIWVAVLLSAAGFVAVVDVGTAPSRPAYADKYDDDCEPADTAGRCADKCPVGYSLQGYDKDTGAAVCKAPPTGCPYGDSVPLGPDCDKLAPATNQQQTVTNDTPPAEPTFGGK